MRNETTGGQLDLLVLSVLTGGALHGYGIVSELRRRSDADLDLAEGTLYPALHRLESEGLLTSAWSEDAPRRRRVYRLTKRGDQALEGRRREWRRFAAAVGRVVEA
ncbi:MAG: helix-turn-helix transcriptional regulator [Nocardioidaceae bacterium]